MYKAYCENTKEEMFHHDFKGLFKATLVSIRMVPSYNDLMNTWKIFVDDCERPAYILAVHSDGYIYLKRNKPANYSYQTIGKTTVY